MLKSLACVQSQSPAMLSATKRLENFNSSNHYDQTNLCQVSKHQLIKVYEYDDHVIMKIMKLFYCE